MLGKPAFKFHLKIRQYIGSVMYAILQEQAEIVDTQLPLGLYPVTGFAIRCVQTSSFAVLMVVDWRIIESQYGRYN